MGKGKRVSGVLAAALGVAAAVGLGLGRGQAVGQQEDAAKLWQTTVEKAVAFLRKSQNENGSWSREPMSRGITGIVVTGLIRTGYGPEDPTTAKGLKYIESLVNAKSGHIAGDDAKATLINYVTSVNVMALAAAKREEKYRAVIGNAVKYLKSYQWDEARGVTPDHTYYGGAGYAGDKSRPDLSNTAFFLEALKEAGVDKNDPAFKKALVFVSRCQNFKSEFNTAEWAGKYNDGSFIYTGANQGENRRTDDTKGDLAGYGSMTYAGIKSMIYCGVSKDDPRMKKALEWIAKNYTLDANPGMPAANSQRGLYYYYHTFAKCMDALGEDTFTDAQGVKHDWRADLLAALAKRQRPDGSWVNENDRWMEGDPNLVTGYALMALSYCKPKK
ncbi:MAG: prenyltransferase/squalene oxidase repeat-containing protein [Thermogemmata sp.]|jgi:squalene-hopene/tetraprenyl-beta-curcumene cyclase|uniref:Terpene cyclase/mutase family protein n=1 Tax=Thermogemmata fonticola TaxID=2755323 RepID=A0A7V8VDK2_9BACT|nr:prenyltransferase/squalene oxidase repeat-containing protein [Thermogemmata fonticola]MBA2226079.1 terpene cyclase/mutase family protein [Thermogemmata fonticola]MCX8140095.1 terpene cyclase/mutase family protein [Gemmataceae bacterium]